MERSSRRTGKHITRWEASTMKCTLGNQQQVPSTHVSWRTKVICCSFTSGYPWLGDHNTRSSTAPMLRTLVLTVLHHEAHACVRLRVREMTSRRFMPLRGHAVRAPLTLLQSHDRRQPLKILVLSDHSCSQLLSRVSQSFCSLCAAGCGVFHVLSQQRHQASLLLYWRDATANSRSQIDHRLH